jgi:hypothetical protein
MDFFVEAQYVYERDSANYILNMMRLRSMLDDLKNEQKALQGIRCLFRNAEMNYEARQLLTAHTRKYFRDFNALPNNCDFKYDNQEFIIYYLDALIK